MLGPCDFVNIVEAPDNETVARVSVMMSSRGSFRIQTMAAVPMDDFIQRLSGGRPGGERRGTDRL